MADIESNTARTIEVTRIENLLAWNQPLVDSDKVLYRDFLLEQWEVAKAALEKAKTDEMELRKKVVKIAFSADKLSGTERVPLYNGYELKGVKKLNYGFVKRADGEGIDKNAIDAALSAIEKDGEVGKLIAQRLVKWDPSLSLTEYKLLSVEHKKAIDAVIVTSDGAPTLEIIPPKGK
jgi:hypothetical protein